MENEPQGFFGPVDDSVPSAPSGPGKLDKAKEFALKNKSSIGLVLGGLIFGVLIGALIFSSGITGAAVSQGDIKDTFGELFPQAKVTSVNDMDPFWNISLLIESEGQVQESEILMTQDGKYLVVGQVIDMVALKKEMSGAEEVEVEVTKSDKPKVELFAMSYCPYGLQMEKALLPVQELLGDTADFSIKFVHYIMHGEKEAVENLRQYCLQKNNPDKFWSYLDCFAAEGDAEKCIASQGLDKSAIDKCVADARVEFKVDEDLKSDAQFPAFRIDLEASNEYGVEGSPTLVINGKIVSVTRSPGAIKNAVCSAFNDAPEACDEELSTTAAGAGFGAEEGSDSEASCG